LPNGDVLVAESNTPKKPDEHFSLRGMAKRVALSIFGAGVPSANRITLLRDKDGDGIAEERSTFLSALNSPFGMALVGDTLYVADTDALLRFPYREGVTKIDAKPEKVADLPAGPINLHWTRNVIASPDGKKLYVTVGSNSNAGEQGMENERNRTAILEIDPSTGQSRRNFAMVTANASMNSMRSMSASVNPVFASTRSIAVKPASKDACGSPPDSA
jgi:glucose/arabinose dehydrogenase